MHSMNAQTSAVALSRPSSILRGVQHSLPLAGKFAIFKGQLSVEGGGAM